MDREPLGITNHAKIECRDGQMHKSQMNTT